MTKKDYQKKYKKSYNNNNKIITFPLSIAFYEELKKRAICSKLHTNSYSKSVLIAFLNDTPFKILSSQQKEFISEYIHISRWVANNINQITHNTNINKQIDVDILIDLLKQYENEFKKFIYKS